MSQKAITFVLLIYYSTCSCGAESSIVCPRFELRGTRFHAADEGTYDVTSSTCDERAVYKHVNVTITSRLYHADGRWILGQAGDEAGDEPCQSDGMLYVTDDATHPRDVTGDWREYGFGRWRESPVVEIICLPSEQVRLTGTTTRSYAEGTYHLQDTTCYGRPAYVHTDGDMRLYYVGGDVTMWIVGPGTECEANGVLYAEAAVSDPCDIPRGVWKEYHDGYWQPAVYLNIERVIPEVTATRTAALSAHQKPYNTLLIITILCLISLAALTVAMVIVSRKYTRLKRMRDAVTRCQPSAFENDYEMRDASDEGNLEGITLTNTTLTNTDV